MTGTTSPDVLLPDASAAARVSTAVRAQAPAAKDAANASIPHSVVLTYIAIASLCLLPGLLGALGVALPHGTPIEAAQRRLLAALHDIRFGSGLRFWLGVTGATMMALLLLYPLRKAFARGRWLGSVRSWFHVHLLLGLFGPVLVLYHANFGHGPLNANVALWSMLVVMASGIAGHFVYMRVSAHFYGEKRQARELLDALVAGLHTVGSAPIPVHALIERLERCETRGLAPRRGVFASVAARWRTSVYAREFHRDLKAILTSCAEEQRWTAGFAEQRGRQLHGLLKAYMDRVRLAAGRSVLEQVWARWRMFHLPVFVVMLVAIVLHVVAVWGVDSRPAEVTQAPTAGKSAQALGDTIRAAAPTQALPVQAEARAGRPPAATTSAAHVAPESQPEDLLARLIAKPVEVSRTQAPQQSTPRASTFDDIVAPPKAPVSAVKATVLTTPTQKPGAVPLPATASSEPVTAPATRVAPSEPKSAIETPVETAPASIEALYAELEKRAAQPAAQPMPTRSEPPMGLGGGALAGVHRVASLSERIADLKQKSFDHNTTRFPLTGKHAKLDCAACHTTTLENNPRECIACHKKDEPHKGRRPDCAKCHTTNRWTQILRRPSAGE